MVHIPPIPGINNANLHSVGLDPSKGGVKAYKIMNGNVQTSTTLKLSNKVSRRRTGRKRRR